MAFNEEVLFNCQFSQFSTYSATVSLAFNKEVVGRVNSMWDDVMSTQEKWKVLHDGFVAGTEVVLGEDCRRQPDWFKDSAAILQPLITS